MILRDNLQKICTSCRHFTIDDWTKKLHCDQEEYIYENSSNYARQLIFPQCFYDFGLYRMADYDLFPCKDLYISKETGHKWWIKLLLLFCKKQYRTEEKETGLLGLENEYQVTYKLLFKKEYILVKFPFPPKHFNCRCVSFKGEKKK